MKTILTLPDPRLRQSCHPVESFDEELAVLVSELDASMRSGPGGVGIAAPQLGVSSRIVLVDCSLGRFKSKNHGLLQMINPEIEEAEGEMLGREGCLSVPDWVGMVPRAKCIAVTYHDVNGNRQRLETSAFEARVIQHEIDHLDGVLFIDRIISTKDLVRRMASA